MSKIGQFTISSLCVEKFDNSHTDVRKFQIPSYQRGYRWSEIQVNALLNDVYDFYESRTDAQAKYCLQPIVVTRATDGESWEVIDGQQRLTTLFLLHWYAAWREGKLELDNYKGVFLHFTYETRPSAHSFLELICQKFIPQTISSFADYLIHEARWFDNTWMLDPSVEAFVIMLDCIHNNEVFNSSRNLFTTLTTKDIVSFYFLPLDVFGLSEEIYTRMNARGKQLTPFEKFKSKLFAAVDYDEDIKKELSEKIEYSWVDSLWYYREEQIYTIDKYFMNLLRFVALVTFYERNLGEKRKKADIDLDDEDQLVSVFDDLSSVKFLINTFDLLPRLRNIADNIMLYPWGNGSGTMGKMLKDVIVDNTHDDITTVLLLYSALQYMIKYKDDIGIKDYLTVVRNMLVNTKDKSQREWPRLLPTLKKLASDNIYDLLLDPDLRIEVILYFQMLLDPFEEQLYTSPVLVNVSNN